MTYVDTRTPAKKRADDLQYAKWNCESVIACLRRVGPEEWAEEIRALRSLRDRLIHEEDVLLDVAEVPGGFRE